MQVFREAGPSNNRNRWKALCLALLILAGGEFVWRGPVRAIRTATQFNDFLSPYIQADAWRRGLDPYSAETVVRLWPAGAAHFQFLTKELADGSLIAKRGIPTAYPIPSLVLIAPFSLLPWGAAYALWLTINLALFAIMLWVLVELAGLSYREPSAALLAAGTLALAPFHTGIVTGNVALVAVELGVIAVWTARRDHDVMTAVLLAAAAGLKPQIGLCFFVYYLARRRWRVIGMAVALLAGVAALGVLRLEVGHTPWVVNYVNDNRVLLETGVLANFTPVNPTRFGLINLQVVLYSLGGSVQLANYLAMGVGAIFLVVWAIVILRSNRSPECELLGLSAIAVISLLPVYHRFYDAAMLVLPLCWVCLSFRKARPAAVVALLLLLPFAIPGGTILETLQVDGRIPAALASHWWWERIVMPHQIWALFFLSILLLVQMMSRRRVHASGSADPGLNPVQRMRQPGLDDGR